MIFGLGLILYVDPKFGFTPNFNVVHKFELALFKTLTQVRMWIHELEFFLRITFNNNATRACYSYYSHQIEKNREKRLHMMMATQERLMFSKFLRKNLFLSLFFYKIEKLQIGVQRLYWKETSCFPVNIQTFVRALISKNTSK